LGELGIRDYLEALGSGAPTPGGGSAASLSGALAAALGRMVISVAQEKQSSAERARLSAQLQELEERFLAFAAEDECAFDEVMDALRIPREAPERAPRLQAALKRAADVPLRAAEAGVSVLRHLAAAEAHASRAIVSDVGAGAHLALAAVQASLLNVAANVQSIRDPALVERLQRDADALTADARAAHALVLERGEARLAAKRA